MTAPDHNEVIDLASNMGGTYEVGAIISTKATKMLDKVLRRRP